MRVGGDGGWEQTADEGRRTTDEGRPTMLADAGPGFACRLGGDRRLIGVGRTDGGRGDQALAHGYLHLLAGDPGEAAAIVPTPTSATSLTETLTPGLLHLRSYINCARSSIEYISWCGGGDINVTPGVEYLIFAISSVTLCPGNRPPSPGFAPWAILICSSFA